MITDNGNSTYGVRFLVNGQAEYVTVNDALPNLPAGYSWGNGSKLEFANGSVAWPELLEKAYAERSGRLEYIKIEDFLEPFHSDPRYIDLLRRMGLPQ